jgi:hypothetical protein
MDRIVERGKGMDAAVHNNANKTHEKTSNKTKKTANLENRRT